MPKKLIALICMAALVLIACSRKPTENKDLLRLGLRVSPLNFDSRIATDAEGLKIANLIFDGLLERTPDMRFKPGLAKSYDMISPTSYRFYLREDVKFHDGKLFKAEDVVYTYTSIRDGEVKSPLQGAFKRFKSVVAEGDYTVRIDLDEPYAPLPTLLVWGIVPVTAKGHADEFNKNPIGTGPYKFISFTPDVAVNLSANENYFGEKPKIKNVKMNIVRDDNIRILKLMKGDLDLVQNGVPSALMSKVLETKNLKMKAEPGAVVSYMGFNLTDPILKNRKVRLAIAYALNRKDLINHQFHGLAHMASSIIPIENWAYDEKLTPYEHDVDRARKLLDEAGFKHPGGDKSKPRFELSYKTTTVKERIAIAEMIAHQLGEVGIDVKVQSYEWGTFFNDVKTGNFQIYTLSWVGVTEPDLYYDVCHSSMWPPNGVNRGRYKNKAMDKLVEAARVELNQEKRKELYDKIQALAHDDLPFMPLWYEDNVVVYKKALEHLGLRADASYRYLIPLEWK